MANTAAHLVDRVLPAVPYRQWVLSLPRHVRFRIACDDLLLTQVLGVFLRKVIARQRRRARLRHRRSSTPLRSEPPAAALGYIDLVRRLTTDMTQDDVRPYFLWDEDISIAELKAILAGPPGPARDRLFGKMLREARDLDVWTFVTPATVARELPGLRRRVGRRYGFWHFLIEGWRTDGLLGA